MMRARTSLVLPSSQYISVVLMTEELLTIIPMNGLISGQEVFRRLCDAIVNAGLPWKRFAGITTGRASSLTEGGGRMEWWHLFKET